MTSLAKNTKTVGFAVAAFTLAAAEYAMAGDMMVTKAFGSVFTVLAGGVVGSLLGAFAARIIDPDMKYDPVSVEGPIYLGIALGLLAGAYTSDKLIWDTNHQSAAVNQNSPPSISVPR